MKKIHLLTLFLNAIAICLLVIVVLYGDDKYPFFECNMGAFGEKFNVNRLLIIPIIILLYNSFNVIRNTLDTE